MKLPLRISENALFIIDADGFAVAGVIAGGESAAASIMHRVNHFDGVLGAAWTLLSGQSRPLTPGEIEHVAKVLGEQSKVGSTRRELEESP